jgi:hypothetical protein
VIFHVNRKNLICSNIFVLGGNKKSSMWWDRSWGKLS